MVIDGPEERTVNGGDDFVSPFHSNEIRKEPGQEGT
jgi:hypothetical protein